MGSPILSCLVSVGAAAPLWLLLHSMAATATTGVSFGEEETHRPHNETPRSPLSILSVETQAALCQTAQHDAGIQDPAMEANTHTPVGSILPSPAHVPPPPPCPNGPYRWLVFLECQPVVPSAMRRNTDWCGLSVDSTYSPDGIKVFYGMFTTPRANRMHSPSRTGA